MFWFPSKKAINFFLALAVLIIPRTVLGTGEIILFPAKVEISLFPGQSAARVLTIRNNTGKNLFFNSSVEDVSAGDKGSEIVKILDSPRQGRGEQYGGIYSLKNYIVVNIDNFRLDNGEEINISVSVNVPSEAPPGGLYGAVLFSADSGKSEEESNAKIIPRLGSLFLVRVLGEVKEEGNLKSFSAFNEQKIFLNNTINFQVLFENRGNVHLNPYGVIEIKNNGGEKIAVLGIDPWFVLPQSERFREMKWDISQNQWGKYKATVMLNRGYGDIIDAMEYEFWYIPRAFVLFAAVGLLIVFMAIAAFAKMKTRRK